MPINVAGTHVFLHAQCGSCEPTSRPIFLLTSKQFERLLIKVKSVLYNVVLRVNADVGWSEPKVGLKYRKSSKLKLKNESNLNNERKCIIELKQLLED